MIINVSRYQKIWHGFFTVGKRFLMGVSVMEIKTVQNIPHISKNLINMSF